MSSTSADSSEVVPSGYGEISKRHGRAPKPASARSRLSVTKKGKKARQEAFGPTPERLAKGDIVDPRVAGGFHRSVSMVEQLRDARQLRKPLSRLSPASLEILHKHGKLDHDAHTAEAMFQAGEKFRRHFEGMGGSVQAQDLNKIIGGVGDDLTREEAWVHHRDVFRTAIEVIGWSATNPHRGAGRIVVAVVCQGMTIYEAGLAYLALKDTNAIKAAAADRLREGLFGLATHWRMI